LPDSSKTKREERQVVVPLVLAGEGLKREGVKEAAVTMPLLCCSLEITHRGEKYIC
jgi:hypothetical protein